MPPFAELAATTNFSFLRGASHAEELVRQAGELGLSGLGVTDRNSLAGVVRAHSAAKETGLPFRVGTRLVLSDGTPEILAWPTDRAAYGRLCRLLTLGNRRAKKGECELTLSDLLDHGQGLCLAMAPVPSGRLTPLPAPLATLAEAFPEHVWLAARMGYGGADRKRLGELVALGQEAGVPLVATNEALYHVPQRRELQDVLSCIREGTTLAAAGRRLEANAERHLKSPQEMARLFRDLPEAVAETVSLMSRLAFSLDELAYEYPDEPTGESATPAEELARLAWAGAEKRYPGGVPAKVKGLVEHELAMIAALKYEPYFLTVHDIVRFARARGILCQGRGSAANSAVCFCLGITEVDPERMDVLFERFVSAERREPPDIDVDFEHERREEVIQYIYQRYGRERAGIAATVITYRARSALREVGKVFGLSEDTAGGLAGQVWGVHRHDIGQTDLTRRGLDPSDPGLKRMIRLAREIVGFPRHLSQHVGGFVITRDRLDETIPIGNAAMADRTFVEWDKDDLDELGILKIDVLALGMLTCVRKALDLVRERYGRELTLATIPAEDEAAYRMLCRADSLGVFQVESRAQMTMLPRLKPKKFYDLVIEVAIVRPGPIQGDMVHPYLRRREGKERVTYPAPSRQHGPRDELKQVLGKTLGVPLFQEQAMRIAIVAAGFTPTEADQLRRAMATFRKVGTIGTFQKKMVEGMVGRGYQRAFAERCFGQIEGFGEYGFPESHAASFALLVYASAWLKCRYPDAFAAALLNSQPMGFYAPAQIVRDAVDHGVEIRPVDVNFSDWDCTLEPGEAPFEVTAEGGEIAAPDSISPSTGKVGPQGGVGAEQLAQSVPPHPTPGSARPSPSRGGWEPGEAPERAALGPGSSPGHAAAEARPGDTQTTTTAAHPGEGRDPEPLAPEQDAWIPASAGMSGAKGDARDETQSGDTPSRAPAPEPGPRGNTGKARSASTSPSTGEVGPQGRVGVEQLAQNMPPHPTPGSARPSPSRGGWEPGEAPEQTALDPGSGPGNAVAEAPPGHTPQRAPAPEPGPRDGTGKVATTSTSPKTSAREGTRTIAAAHPGEGRDPGPLAPAPDALGPGSSPGHEVVATTNTPPQFPQGTSGKPPIHPLHADQENDILSTHAMRLGLRQVKGLSEAEARMLVERRGAGYDSVRDLWLRSGLTAATIARLADADCFASLGLDRRAALWAARALDPAGAAERMPLFETAGLGTLQREPDVHLPPMPPGEEVVHDYRFLRLSLKAHPVSFLRGALDARKTLRNEKLRDTASGRTVTVAGLVLVRQRPGSAKGVIFMTMEDETGVANVIVWPKAFERFRAEVLGGRFISVTGQLQKEGEVIHLVAHRIEDLSPMLTTLCEEGPALGETRTPDPRQKGIGSETLSRADAVKNPGIDMRDKTSRTDRRQQMLGIAIQRPLAANANAELREVAGAMPKGRNFH